ncbi:amylopullulanase [Bacillus sp. BGMRC 2118]|nr:amylopullulanase [Bacillus sp. BGMRC 2118]
MNRQKRKAFTFVMLFAMIIQLFTGLLPYANVSAEVQSPVINGNEVTFNYEGTGSEANILLVGTFNGWATTGESVIQLTKGDNNIWSVTNQLEDGQHQYKFIVDGNWMTDPLNPATTNERNSVFTIGEGATPERTVTLVGSLQDELGASADWSPGDSTTNLIPKGNNFYEFTGQLPPGDYEYKIAINGKWDENYGANGNAGGENIKLHVDEETTVTFLYHDDTHKIADSTWYEVIPADKQPRVVGNIQPAIGAGSEWSPSESTALLYDDNFDSIYTFQTDVTKGNYEYKIVLGNNWDGQAFPSSNATLNVLENSPVTFFFNNGSKDVYTDYTPTGSDGSINGDALYHDTWNEAYRKPFGAIPTGEEVTLRLAAKKGDLTKASLQVKNYQTGNTKIYPMENAGWMEVENQGQVDFWEVTFTPTDKGVHGYKFIASDKDAVFEYGEDTIEGGLGKGINQNAGLFQLTVYDPGFKTPDWMKEAVVYQIFPDRFYNGNTANDSAKDETGARGLQPIEHKEWSELPDNPRQMNEPNYTGDGEWSNDFFGGDIAGIQEKLDYIQSLGVNTLYLNPVAHAASNHKYDATDYKAIDPMFGTPEEFEAFTKELESRNMHLILDGVFNHVGDDSVYFDRYGKYETVGAYEYWALVYDLVNKDGLTDDEAKQKARTQLEAEGQVFNDEYGFHNWFNIENEKVDVGTPLERYKYQAWWGFDSLPEIKSVPGEAVNYDSELNNKKFADYIMYDEDSAAKSWITTGGSGWRLDVANEVDMEFWREFRKELKATSFAGTGNTLQEGEEPLILGEIWDDASQYFLGDQYDSVMNYRFERAVMSYMKNGKAEELERAFQAIQEDYPEEVFHALMNLMDSHDTPRAIFLLGGGTDSFERAELDPNYNYELGKTRLMLSSIMQMGYAGAPTIYYGDEAGVTGSKDPDDRRTYPWGKEDQELVAHYKKIGKVREDHQDLFAYGKVNHVYATGDVFAFTRTNDDKAAIVITNRGTSEKTVKINVKDILLNGVTLTDQLDSAYRVSTKNNEVSITIPANTGRMLVSTDTLPQAPEKATNLQVEESSKQVTLNWSGNATTYKVYETNIQGALYKEVTTTSETSITIDNLTNGRTYYFGVVAVDENGNESALIETQEVIPHYELSAAIISDVSELQDGNLDLSATYNVTSGITIDGATNEGLAEGVQAKLLVKKDSGDTWEEHQAIYVSQNESVNVFQASFLPLETGSYSYKMSFTTDGRKWKDTNVKTVNLNQNPDDKQAPADSITLETPTQESGQVNLSWSVNEPVENDAYLVAIIRNGVMIDILKDPLVTTYRDYGVENGTQYEYQIKLYDRYGNSAASNVINVTPDIVMVEVTFKVKAPDYTPLNVPLTMPNSLNGWNTGAWEMSRNGAVTADWEYTVDVQEGTEITYKYVKNGSWDQEGLADHTPNDRSDDDMSYYGYGAIGSDMKVIVENQGNNKMVVQDYILRWIDQPLVITGPTTGTETDKETITVTGNTIKEGNLTINGEPVPVNNDMTFSHEVKLNYGENIINLHIEPSEDSKANIFQNDSEAIAKNTKNYTISVFSSFISDPGEIVITEEEATMKEVKEGDKTRVIVTPQVEKLKKQLKENKDFHTLTLYVNSTDKLAEAVLNEKLVQEVFKRNKKANIVVKTKYAEYIIPVDTLHQGSLAQQVRGKVEGIRIQLDAKQYQAAEELLPSSDAVTFNVVALTSKGEKNITSLKKEATLKITGYDVLNHSSHQVISLPSKNIVETVTFEGKRATFTSQKPGTFIIKKK